MTTGKGARNGDAGAIRRILGEIFSVNSLSSDLAFAPAPDGNVDYGGTSEQTGNHADAETDTRADCSANTRNLLEASHRLGGADAPVYFGPESAGKLAESREKELTKLGEEPQVPFAPEAQPTFVGGEHSVYTRPTNAEVIKHTLAGALAAS